jgi:hypothetical protein
MLAELEKSINRRSYLTAMLGLWLGLLQILHHIPVNTRRPILFTIRP